ncbi:MAG: trigger factor [Acidobacteria bacterium]|nr:MAG: trigger factor [Acidobacteriota bacterium]
MTHQITKHPDHSLEITADLDKTAVDQEREVIARRLRSQAQVPGFRPGKAPLSAVRMRYAEEIQEELTEHLAGLLWRQILDDEDEFQPLTQPDFEEMGFGDDGGFSFKARLEVRPSFDLPSLDGIELPEHSIEVMEAEIQTELDGVCEEHVTWEPMADDAQVVDGVMIEADLTAEVEGSDEAPTTEENARIIVGADGIPKEISEALQGARVGDQRVAVTAVNEESAEGDDTETTTGSATYTLTVKTIKEKSLPEIDDELARGMGLDDLDQLKERIVEVLGGRKASERRDKWRRHILDNLEQGIDHENLPPTLVKEAVNGDVQRFVYHLAMQGQAPDEQMDVQALRARFEPESRLRVLDTLILEQLGDTWEIEVPEDDVHAYIAGEAEQKGIPPGEHKANLIKENRFESLRHAALMAAIVSELLKRAGAEED